MRKVNQRSRQLRHHNSGTTQRGLINRIKSLLSFKPNRFSINHQETSYEGYSLPKPTRASLFSYQNLRKYATHGGIITVGVFTILANTCLGGDCNDIYSRTRFVQASQKDLIEVDMNEVDGALLATNTKQMDKVANALSDYTSLEDKKAQIDQALLDKEGESQNLALIQDSFLEKKNNPITNISDAPRKNVIVHIVKDDETLWTIADKYELSTDTIEWSNGMNDSGIVIPGQELFITPIDGIYYQIQDGDTISSISEKYKSDLDAIYEWNDDIDDGVVLGQRVFLPGGEVPPPPKPVAPVNNTYNNNSSYVPQPTYNSGPVSGTGQFGWPTSGMTITQYFGTTSFNPWHTGIDIDSRSGWDIWASDGGTVVTATYGWGGGYGNHIIIDHGNGYQTLYGHLSSLDVSVGQYVSQGQRLGTMGSTGWSTGPHLHFEIRYGGSYLNPLNYL